MRTITSINKEILEFVNSIGIEDDFERKITEDLIFAFVSNGQGKVKRALLEIAKNIDWYQNKNAIATVIKNVKNLDRREEYFFVKSKDSIGSSSNKLLSILVSEGYISEKRVIALSQKEEIPFGTTVVLIDDFIGTGNSLLKVIIPHLEKFKIIIIYHTITQSAIERLSVYKNITLFKSGTVILDNYTNKKLSLYQINLINKICEHCGDNEYSFGYKKSGLMLSYEGIAPNNDISILWYKVFKPPFNNWIPLLNREARISKIDEIRRSIFADKKATQSTYIKIKDKIKIDYKNFLILLIIRMFCYDAGTLMGLSGIDTIEELLDRIGFLVQNEVITLVDSTEYEIVENVNILISESIRTLISEAGRKEFFVV